MTNDVYVLPKNDSYTLTFPKQNDLWIDFNALQTKFESISLTDDGLHELYMVNEDDSSINFILNREQILQLKTLLKDYD